MLLRSQCTGLHFHAGNLTERDDLDNKTTDAYGRRTKSPERSGIHAVGEGTPEGGARGVAGMTMEVAETVRGVVGMTETVRGVAGMSMEVAETARGVAGMTMEVNPPSPPHQRPSSVAVPASCAGGLYQIHGVPEYQSSKAWTFTNSGSASAKSRYLALILAFHATTSSLLPCSRTIR